METGIKEKSTSLFRKIALITIMDGVCGVIDVKPEQVANPGRVRDVVKARHIFSYIACRLAGYRLKEVSDYLNCSEVNVSKMLRRLEENFLTEHEKEIEGVRLKLSIIT